MAEEAIEREVARLRDIIYAGRPEKLLEAQALARLKTVVSPVGSASTDSEHFFVDPNFWKKLTTEEKLFTMAHEADHFILGDPEYIKVWGLDGRIFNIASDCYINRRHIRQFRVRPEFENNIITPRTLAKMVREIGEELGLPESKIKDEGWFEEAEKMDIYYYLVWLLKQARRAGCATCEEVFKNLARKALSGDVKPSKYSVEDAKIRREQFKRTAKELEKRFKTAGREAGDFLERGFGLGRRMIRWEEVIEEVLSYIAFEYISTWKRPSRRHPSYPGYYKYGMPGAVLLIDVSGSISSEELGKFMTEVKYLMEEYGIEWATVIFWSYDVVKKMEDISPADVPEVVETAKKIPSGGTLLHKALKEAMKYASDDRVVIVFTDGALADSPEELYDLAVKASSQFARAVLVYTTENPAKAGKMPPTGWTYVRYPLRV